MGSHRGQQLSLDRSVDIAFSRLHLYAYEIDRKAILRVGSGLRSQLRAVESASLAKHIAPGEGRVWWSS